MTPGTAPPGQPAAPAAILLEGVGRSFAASDAPALAEVSVRVAAGEFVAVVGPSGSGKSTLLNILGLMDRPSTGRYLLFGQDTSALRGDQRDRVRGSDLGFIFQSSQMLPDVSVLTNVELGLRCQNVPPRPRRDAAEAALGDVGLADKADASSRLLSGGQQQRVAVARAIATSPRLILADEPTGSLDTANGQRILDLLAQLHRQGATVLLVTHDLAMAHQADRILELRDGHLIADTRSAGIPRTASVSGAGRSPDRPRWASSAARRARMGDLAQDALRSLRHRALRTLLLVGAFTLGVAGLFGSIGMASSAASQVTGRLTAASTDQLVVRPPLDPRDQQPLQAARTAAAGVSHVRTVGVTVQVAAQHSRITRRPGGEAAEVSLFGASPEFIRFATTDLQPAHAADSLTGRWGPVALVSRRAAEELALPRGPSGVGRGAMIQVNGVPTPVLGVFEVSERAPELARAVVVPVQDTSGIVDTAPELVVITDPGYPATVAKALPLAIAPADPGSVRAETVADLQGLRIGVSADLAVLIGAVGLVVLVVAALGASTAISLSVESRTAEIALRRALGATRRGVAAIFLAEGVLVGLIGGAWGAALGQAAVILIAGIRQWSPVVSESAWWQAPLLGIATGLVSAAYPAWRASRKEPALGLRS